MAQVIGNCDRCGALVNAAFVDADGVVRLDVGAAQAHWQESEGCLASGVSAGLRSMETARDAAESGPLRTKAHGLLSKIGDAIGYMTAAELGRLMRALQEVTDEPPAAVAPRTPAVPPGPMARQQ